MYHQRRRGGGGSGGKSDEVSPTLMMLLMQKPLEAPNAFVLALSVFNFTMPGWL